ncbi:MAG: VWA domain-containing protein [Hydrogenovibrio crunogenus]|uniref:Type A von Willebrand factor-like n=1 Tax=Hydrogenovibrio crunogenus (strain DSM 25203 / XCL-2) TaxID=317025 RepID=Q31JK3_HYDCU|nr:VWA domain-containing protein [Hydrogenovibrio crunogenus]
MNLTDLTSIWQQFEFIWPWMIAFAPLPWLIRILLKPAVQRQTPLLAPHLMQRLRHTPQPQFVQANRRSIKIPLTGIFLWSLVVLAAMRPVWFLNTTPFQASGKDLMLAVDLSGSMEKTDMPLRGVEVDRLTAVKSVVKNFIQKRQGDRMGLVVFGSQAFLQSPLTYDLNTVETLLNETEIGMAGNNTAIGDAIGIALKHLHQNSEKKAVLILLTDGSNTAGAVQPLDAAKQAQEMGLKIYTIGIGQNQATGLDAFIFGPNRNMDTTTLQKIAELTQGRFFMAKDTNQLNEIYQLIDQLEASQHDINNYRLREELFIWPLGLTFLLSLLLMGLKLYPLPHAVKNTPEGET